MFSRFLELVEKREKEKRVKNIWELVMRKLRQKRKHKLKNKLDNKLTLRKPTRKEDMKRRKGGKSKLSKKNSRDNSAMLKIKKGKCNSNRCRSKKK